MAMRYIIQKREIKERHGRKPQLMGPYRTCYSDIRPPFDLSDKEKIEANLLRRYGEGRYQVKSVGKAEGEEKSKITVYFTGDVEKYKPRSKTWSKEERLEYQKIRKRTTKERIFVSVAFFIAFLVVFWLFIAALTSGLDSSLAALALILITIVFLAAVFFMDLMFYTVPHGK